VEHKFTDTNKIRNSLRYSKTKQDYIWTQPDDSKGNAINGYVWRRGNARVSDTTTLQNVTEFTGKEQTGSIGHSYAFGLELSKEKPSPFCRHPERRHLHLGGRPWCTT
jgi:catecholate siderophore receptor